MWPSHCSGFSFARAQAVERPFASVLTQAVGPLPPWLKSTGLKVVVHRLRLPVACDLTGPGMEHGSPALAGGFFAGH